MPLIDHFHPPVSRTHRWESFHARWAGTLADWLHLQLPDARFLVEVQVTIGSRIEADVVEWKMNSDHGNGGGAGVALAPYVAPAALRSLDFHFPDDIEVQVYDCLAGKTLVGVIELVSPSNKDRPDSRFAFAAKCLTYLHRGIGLIVVDIVTERRANLHNELLAMLGQQPEQALSADGGSYAVAYRPVRRDEMNQLDLWPAPLLLNQPLPVLPLTLKGGPCVPADLETTYSQARRVCRL